MNLGLKVRGSWGFSFIVSGSGVEIVMDRV